MPDYKRLEYIKKNLFNNKFITLKDILTHFKISKRTFLRDIKFLKQEIGLNIKYSRENERYEISYQEVEDVFFKEKNLLFYSFIESLSENEIYIPFVIKEVLQSLNEKLFPEYKKLISRIHYECEEHTKINLEHFKIFITAFLENKRLKIKYQNKTGLVSERKIFPLYFLNYASQWYFISYDYEKKEIRKFNAGRILEVKKTGETSDYYINDYKLKNYIINSFGIYKDYQIKRVKIRFYEPVYFLVKNQKWHKDEEREEYKDEQGKNIIELTIPVGDYEEIIGKILRYLPYAEAVEPEYFRNKWLERIKEGAGKFLGIEKV